jgi:hypothetical protein
VIACERGNAMITKARTPNRVNPEGGVLANKV